MASRLPSITASIAVPIRRAAGTRSSIGLPVCRPVSSTTWPPRRRWRAHHQPAGRPVSERSPPSCRTATVRLSSPNVRRGRNIFATAAHPAPAPTPPLTAPPLRSTSSSTPLHLSYLPLQWGRRLNYEVLSVDGGEMWGTVERGGG